MKRMSERGMTIVEATIVLMATSILIAALAPSASRTLDSARLTRAQEDIDAIALAVHNFVTECCSGFEPFTTTGLSGGTTVEMLVGDGDTPLSNGCISGCGDWDDPVDINGPGIVTDFLENHLVSNLTFSGGSYATGSPGWRGAYLNGPVDPDPWGNRYVVNVEFLRTSTTNDVFVLSTGPDEEIDTQFAVNGAAPGDDDLTSVIRRDLGDTFTVP